MGSNTPCLFFSYFPIHVLIFGPYFLSFKKNFDSPEARLKRAKGQKGKGLFRSPGGETHKTKTNIVADRLDREIEAVADRRATPPRKEVPGAAS